MKLKEIFNSENGIFEKVFKPSFPVLYGEIFGDDSPILLDLQVRRNYGDKELTSDITNETAQETIKSVITVKFDEWSKQIQVFNLSYDVLNPTLSKETETVSAQVDETGNNTNIDSKTAFNDGEFNNDSKQQRDTTGNRQETSEKTVTKSGVTSSLPVSEVIQKEITLRKQNFKELVITSLINEITLSIY